MNFNTKNPQKGSYKQVRFRPLCNELPAKGACEQIAKLNYKWSTVS